MSTAGFEEWIVKRDDLWWRGHRVHVIEAGEGEPLLLVTGVGGNTDMWGPFARQFPDRRILSFDAPGTGRSSTPFYPVDIPSLAQLASAVLDHFDVESADVLGYSYGGAVVQQLAHDEPRRVRRLVLAATHCGKGCVPGTNEAVTGVYTPLRFYSPSFFNRTAGRCFGGVTARNSEVRNNLFDSRSKHPPTVYGYAMQWMGIAGWSSKPFLDKITHETLVISGDEDPLVPLENAQLLARHIPNATLEVVERGGHLLLMDDAVNLGERIGRFLAGGAPSVVPPRTVTLS